MGSAAIARRRHTVQLHFSAGFDGQQIPDASLRILCGERIVLAINRTGSSLSVALSPGRYVAEAEYRGVTRRQTLEFGEAGGVVAFFHFRADP
jgi:hypothetical protein